MPSIYERITPACAGKSSGAVFLGGEAADHPRVCGEKAWSSALAIRSTGSPPRVRGKGSHV